MVIPATPLARSPWADARWLVLAPHADDETLGTGALIADAAARGRLAGVVFLTDGSGSHPCPAPADRTRLIRRRRAEAAQALRILAGPRTRAPIFLDWPDAHPHADDGGAAKRSARTLGALVRRLGVDAIATTAADEPHCDHAACYRLATRVARDARRAVAVFEYGVWGTPDPTARAFRTRAILSGRRHAALMAHGSQLGGRFGDGFRLSADTRRMPTTDVLHLVDRHANRP